MVAEITYRYTFQFRPSVFDWCADLCSHELFCTAHLSNLVSLIHSIQHRNVHSLVHLSHSILQPVLLYIKHYLPATSVHRHMCIKLKNHVVLLVLETFCPVQCTKRPVSGRETFFLYHVAYIFFNWNAESFSDKTHNLQKCYKNAITNVIQIVTIENKPPSLWLSQAKIQHL